MQSTREVADGYMPASGAVKRLSSEEFVAPVFCGDQRTPGTRMRGFL
jgi:hypothetical protein